MRRGLAGWPVSARRWRLILERLKWNMRVVYFESLTNICVDGDDVHASGLRWNDITRHHQTWREGDGRRAGHSAGHSSGRSPIVLDLLFLPQTVE